MPLPAPSRPHEPDCIWATLSIRNCICTMFLQTHLNPIWGEMALKWTRASPSMRECQRCHMSLSKLQTQIIITSDKFSNENGTWIVAAVASSSNMKVKNQNSNEMISSICPIRRRRRSDAWQITYARFVPRNVSKWMNKVNVVYEPHERRKLEMKKANSREREIS